MPVPCSLCGWCRSALIQHPWHSLEVPGARRWPDSQSVRKHLLVWNQVAKSPEDPCLEIKCKKKMYISTGQCSFAELFYNKCIWKKSPWCYSLTSEIINSFFQSLKMKQTRNDCEFYEKTTCGVFTQRHRRSPFHQHRNQVWECEGEIRWADRGFSQEIWSKDCQRNAIWCFLMLEKVQTHLPVRADQTQTGAVCTQWSWDTLQRTKTLHGAKQWNVLMAGMHF